MTTNREEQDNAEASALMNDLLDFVRARASSPLVAASAMLTALLELTRRQGNLQVARDEYETLIVALQGMRASRKKGPPS